MHVFIRKSIYTWVLLLFLLTRTHIYVNQDPQGHRSLQEHIYILVYVTSHPPAPKGTILQV